jgi:hypothetical protein
VRLALKTVIGRQPFGRVEERFITRACTLHWLRHAFQTPDRGDERLITLVAWPCPLRGGVLCFPAKARRSAGPPFPGCQAL